MSEAAMSDAVSFRLRLEEYRLRARLSQMELAERAGTRQATIANLETGKSLRVELDLLGRIAEALGCKPSELLDVVEGPRQKRRKKKEE